MSCTSGVCAGSSAALTAQRAELGGVLLDGGQLRPRIQGFDGAVEGDDGDVFGDAQAAFVNRAQGSECFKVRRREDRVWRVVAFQQRCGGFVAAFSCEP